MKELRDLLPLPTRGSAWTHSLQIALVSALVAVLVSRLLLKMVGPPSFILAAVVFIIVLGLMMRMTPRDES